jgi:hypothetical protein
MAGTVLQASEAMVSKLLLSLANGLCGEVLVFQILGYFEGESSQRGQKCKPLCINGCTRT